MLEIKLYKSPFKGLKLIALAISFVAIGIWMIMKEPYGTNDYILGWISISFFGLCIPLGLFNMFDKRPQIIITENGILDRTNNQDEIKWEQIKSACTLEIYKQKFISLLVDETFILKKKQFRWAAKINEVIGAQKVNLNLSTSSSNDRNRKIA